MNSPRRILYVVNDAAFFLSHRLPIAAAARAAGFDVHVATPEGEAARGIPRLGFAFHALDMTRSGMHPMAEARTILGLIRLYRSLAPDLVHHVALKAVLYGGIAARLTEVPAAVSVLTGLGHTFVANGWRARVLRRLVSGTFRFALGHPNEVVIFQNPDDQRAMLEMGAISSEGAVLIRGSGVDMREFSPTPEPDEPVLTVLASRMLWSKGIGEFVEAARRLRRAGVRARFALVGDIDPDNPAAVPAAQLAEWNDTGVVEWWGRRDDMPTVFAQCHVMCLPSYYGEGVPKALIEAAACARPIVTTDAPGCREVVRDGDNGLLVPIRDVEALAAALRRLIESRELRTRMGHRSREIAVAEFSVEHVVRATLAVYERLLSRKHES